MTNNSTLELLRKKLLYRSLHRGCKETDILLGNFALEKLHNFSTKQIEIYEQFLEESDNDIYAWTISNEGTPTQYTALISEIKQFHNL